MWCSSSLIIVLVVGFRQKSLLIAVLLSLGIFLIGNFAMTKIILARDDPRPVPELTRKPGDLGLGHNAVVYFKPQTYNPIGWINQFNEFDE